MACRAVAALAAIAVLVCAAPASAAVDVNSDVALRVHGGCAGVQTHSHGDLPRRQRPLRRGRGGHRGACGREGDEERIPLGIDLHTALGGEGIPQDRAVLRERLRVHLRPELPQQAGGALDVGEQKRHRPRGQVTPHVPSIADDFARDGPSGSCGSSASRARAASSARGCD